MLKTACIWIMVVLVCVSGCRRQTVRVRPVEPMADNAVCIVENANGQAEVLAVYERLLERKGYAVSVLPANATNAEIDACSTYSTLNAATAKWESCWYLARADIRVFKAGQPAGSASFVSKKLNVNKCIGVESKLSELVDRLFPYVPDR